MKPQKSRVLSFVSTVQSWTWQPQSCVPDFLGCWNIQSVRSHKLDFSIVRTLESATSWAEAALSPRNPSRKPLKFIRIIDILRCAELNNRFAVSADAGPCGWGREAAGAEPVGGGGGGAGCFGTGTGPVWAGPEGTGSARAGTSCWPRPGAPGRQPTDASILSWWRKHSSASPTATAQRQAAWKNFLCSQRLLKTSLKQRCALEFSYLPDFFSLKRKTQSHNKTA